MTWLCSTLKAMVITHTQTMTKTWMKKTMVIPVALKVLGKITFQKNTTATVLAVALSRTTSNGVYES